MFNCPEHALLESKSLVSYTNTGTDSRYTSTEQMRCSLIVLTYPSGGKSQYLGGFIVNRISKTSKMSGFFFYFLFFPARYSLPLYIQYCAKFLSHFLYILLRKNQMQQFIEICKYTWKYSIYGKNRGCTIQCLIYLPSIFNTA